jgi:GNAT superfamily N-acetyltransferase
MTDPLSLRPAEAGDFDFCRRLYFEGMAQIIAALKLDEARQRESFARQWQVTEVRIIVFAGEEIGWLQTALREGAVFLAQIYIDQGFQGRGIGTRVLQGLLETASRECKAVELGVVKINPARRLYERLGFVATHEDQYKVYMRRSSRLGTSSP